MAYAASGGRRGFAQSLFQVGGNAGSAIGPLLAAMLIAPFGQFHVIWFSIAALTAIIILYRIGKWYKPKSIRKKEDEQVNLRLLHRYAKLVDQVKRIIAGEACEVKIF